MKYDVHAIARAFDVRGKRIDAKPSGSGLIHDTFVVTADGHDTPARYVLQRINHEVFKDPVQVMENIARITRHIAAKLADQQAADAARRTLTLVPAVDGALWHRDGDGNVWRMFDFIEGAQTHDEIANHRQALEAAKAFGEFQRQLLDLPPPRLHETIPGFHHSRSRFNAFLDVLGADACNRAAAARPEIAFVEAREAVVDVLLDLHRAGEIPERVTHNDTKLNNVMIDNTTQDAVCVIDLDTVMPGLAPYDFGDMVRTATSPAAEDERDLGRVTMQISMFETLAVGYLSTAGGFLNAAEKAHLPMAGLLITLEQGIRFLTDFLQGDTYYKVRREGQNLDRCRTQFALVQSMEAQQESMEKAVSRALKSVAKGC